MCYLRHRLWIFYFIERLCSVLEILKFLYFLTISWFTKSVMSWWVSVHETVCIFECIFWTTTHQVTKLGQLIDISDGNNSQKSFAQFGGLGLSSRFFSSSRYILDGRTHYCFISIFAKLKFGVCFLRLKIN